MDIVVEEELVEDEGSGKDGEEDDETLLENTYYNAKGQREEDPKEALELFETIVDIESGTPKKNWSFKALKQMIKLLFKTKQLEKIPDKYKQLLSCMSSITRNDMEKAINNVLNLLSSDQSSRNWLEKIYMITLDTLQKQHQKDDKLWFNTKLRMGFLYFDSREFNNKLEQVIKELTAWCLLPDGQEDNKKSSQLLDIFILEIQIATVLNDRKKQKKLYDRCMSIFSNGAVVLNPKSTGIIRECGGKMNLRDKAYKAAYADFFEAFKSYDDAGDQRRIRCLCYLVLSAMLMSRENEIDVNPFEAPETKPYKNHVDIEPMEQLLGHFFAVRRDEFDKTLRKYNMKVFQQDEFMKDFQKDLIKNFRFKLILKIIQPYTKIQMAFIKEELNVDHEEVEGLLVDLILDGRLNGRLDQVRQVLILESKNELSRYRDIQKWSQKLWTIAENILNHV